MDELVWAGLVQEYTGQTRKAPSTVANALAQFAKTKEEEIGSKTIVHYDVGGQHVVDIFVDSTRVGFGILCTDEDQAKTALPAAQALLSRLNLLGTPSAWKMYTGPTKAA